MKSPKKWFEERRKIDDLDGLWRIHDNLYDVSSFISKHPGGKFWLEETKGLDITEAFESHHIKSDAPEQMLQKYFVKKATKPRTSLYTIEENGFYKTLKKKVRSELQKLPKDCHKTTDIYMDLLLLTALTLACLANVYKTYILTFTASLLCSFVIVASHNYSHQRDNLRMLYGDLFMNSARQFRIVHVLSHHAFPNSKLDLQLDFPLPIVNSFPEKKSYVVKYLAWISATMIVFPFTGIIIGIAGILDNLFFKKDYPALIYSFILPILMYYTSNNTLSDTMILWVTILLLASTFFSIIAYTTTHIHPDLYIEGDARRPKEQLDWGICQLDTIYERKAIRGNLFLTLVLFGDHVLHHLFPTLDHSYLIHLYPVLEETLKEFNFKDLNYTTTLDLYLGYFRQAAREIPKTTRPSL